MITKRTPIRPPGGRKRISAAAIAAFRQMEQLALQCECPPIDWGGKYWQRPPACASCDRWWDQHSILHRELQLEPWYWPVYQHPDRGRRIPKDHRRQNIGSRTLKAKRAIACSRLRLRRLRQRRHDHGEDRRATTARTGGHGTSSPRLHRAGDEVSAWQSRSQARLDA
jgi:hypothetical protein